MKTLVAYYSRTKTTKKVAEMIAAKLGADTEEVTDKTNRGGVVGYVIACKDSIAANTTAIADCRYDPAAYDLVVIGSPVWVGRVTPAIRAYLLGNAAKIKRVAFFTTQGGSNRQRVFADLKELAGKDPATELQITTKEAVTGDPGAAIEEFCRKLTS